MLDSDAIQTLVDLDKSGVEEIDGVQFHVSPRGATAVKFPSYETMRLFSLNQVINFLKAHDFEADEKLDVNVLDFAKVQICAANYNENKEIDVLAEADFSKVFAPFPFGTRMNQQDFIINVMTKFVRNETTEELLKLVSNVKAEKVQTADDDGYSQVAGTKSGVVLSTQAKVKNIWELQTHKTFPEVEQPVIPYVLRLYQRGDEMPDFALHDCDGGLWKVKLTNAIREWIIQRLKSEKAELLEKVNVL